MNLHEALAKEHSKKQTDRIVKYIGDNPARFAELMELFFTSEYRIVQRAAWPMSYCVRAHPALIKPYFKRLLDYLDKPGNHMAVVRNTVRLLQEVKIPERFRGRVMDRCFGYIQSPETPVAVRAFSLTILEHMTRDYPDILPELRLIIEEQWDSASAAFRSRGIKILRKN